MSAKSTDIDWKEAERIVDLPAVDDAVRSFLNEPSADSAIMMVREIMHATMNQAIDEAKEKYPK